MSDLSRELNFFALVCLTLLHAEGVQVGWIAQDVEEADQVYAFLFRESPRMEGSIM